MQEAARAGQLVLNDFLNPAVPCDSLTYLDDIQVQSDAGGLHLHHVDLQVDSWLDIQHVEAEVNVRLLHLDDVHLQLDGRLLHLHIELDVLVSSLLQERTRSNTGSAHVTGFPDADHSKLQLGVKTSTR